MRDVVDDIQASHILLIEQIDGLRVLLAEERHEDVCPGDLFLAGGLHMEDGSLQDALETERRLRVAIFAGRDQRGRFVDEGGDLAAQLLGVRTAGLENLRGGRVIQKRQQHMLDRHVLVMLHARLLEGPVQRKFKFFAQHWPNPSRVDETV